MRQGTLAMSEISLDIFGPVLQDSPMYESFQRTLSFDVRSNQGAAEGANISGRLSWKVQSSRGHIITIFRGFLLSKPIV